jgi:RNA polymerase sigma factor (sigma-70 family)
MATGGQGAVLKSFQDLLQTGAVGGATDGELLDRFARRDGASAEVAFAALVERHGPMVLQLCRALLRDAHEAEDAFQATFLVLARRAGSIREPGLLANWLYGVAHRTARKARARALRRRTREVQEEAMPALEAVDQGGRHDLTLAHREQAGLIHQELGRLPEKHRSVVVLCCLEGLTVEESARRLRLSPGAVRGRLAQARSRLKERLARRGVAVPSAVLAALLSARDASAIPPGLRDSTTRAALGFIGAAASGVASAPVADLARNVSRRMALSSLKLPAFAFLALAAAGALLASWASGPPRRYKAKAPTSVPAANKPDGAPVEGPVDPRRFVEGLDWILSAVDPDRGTIAVHAGKDRAGPQAISLIQFRGQTVPSGLGLGGLKVAADARVDVDGRPADLTQLRAGMRLKVDLAPDRLAVTRIHASWGGAGTPLFVQVVENVDVEGKALSFSLSDRPRRLVKVRVAEGTPITRLHARPDEGLRVSRLGLRDLRPGTPASIELQVGEDGRLTVSSLVCAVGHDGEERTR